MFGGRLRSGKVAGFIGACDSTLAACTAATEFLEHGGGGCLCIVVVDDCS